jgi:CheY-like chemotaxis protein
MSHELRTPLNAIIGYSEMLLEEMDESARDAAHAADLEKIRAAGRQLLVLINDVLDLSKIEAGKVGLSLETFDVAALVAELKAMVQPAAAKTGNRLEVDCAAEIGTMSADPGKVRQLLLNLLSNALKFTDHGVVRLEASRLARDGREWMTFTVSDTGIGMTGEQMGRLFQAFSQAEEKIAVRFGGTGLGLAISQRLCRLMGGQITVSSELGRGSVFAACVPVNVEPIAAYAEPARQQTADADPPLADTQTAPVVLVVDDDPIARDLLVRTLTACGYAVRAATSGEEGLRLARELRPMAITLDLLMPGLDGWAVLARLKEDEKTANIPVIVISTVGEQARGEGMKRGASEILPKPVERQRLSAILARHCGPQRGGPAAA